MPITPLDLFFIALVGVATLRCTVRGFVAEIMSVAAVAVGIGAGLLLSGSVSGLIARRFGDSPWNGVIAFLALFLAGYLVVKLLAGAINRAIEAVSLGSLDRALGFFLGLAEGLLAAAVVVFVLEIQPFFNVSDALKASRFATEMTRLLPAVPFLHERPADPRV